MTDHTYTYPFHDPLPDPFLRPLSAKHLPLTVWPIAQRDPRVQRRGRYHKATTEHPARMYPDLAAYVISFYSRRGELVFDPMTGIGTTLVEAIHLGRPAVGVEFEPAWAAIARTNVKLTRKQGVDTPAYVVCGDARQLPGLLDRELRGKVALVLTSPPYGRSAHGLVETTRGEGVSKRHHTYGPDPDNLAYQPLGRMLAGFGDILAGCIPLLHPDGTVVVTARTYRRQGELVDLPAGVITAARSAGLVLVERNVALLAAVRGDELVARPSFFQLLDWRRARAAGILRHVPAHEEVAVFKKPGGLLGVSGGLDTDGTTPAASAISGGVR